MKSGKPITISFKAHLARFGSLVDGAVRVSFDLAPHDTQALVDLSKYQSHVFNVVVVPEPNKAQETRSNKGPW